MASASPCAQTVLSLGFKALYIRSWNSWQFYIWVCVLEMKSSGKGAYAGGWATQLTWSPFSPLPPQHGFSAISFLVPCAPTWSPSPSPCLCPISMAVLYLVLLQLGCVRIGGMLRLHLPPQWEQGSRLEGSQDGARALLHLGEQRRGLSWLGWQHHGTLGGQLRESLFPPLVCVPGASHLHRDCNLLGVTHLTSVGMLNYKKGSLTSPVPTGAPHVHLQGTPTDYVAGPISTISCLYLYIINAQSELC